MTAGGFDSATLISVGHALTPEDIATAAGSGVVCPDDVAPYALRLGDDSLILAQRLCWWVSRAPEMEEDVALGNIALDLLGHARCFLSYAGSAWGKTEDDLAYFRDEHEFVSAHLVELDNGDFGQTIARQLVFSAYARGLYAALQASSDETLAAIAAKASKEVAYHFDHAAKWTVRLGQGTEESARRMQHGLNVVWPYIDELFEDDPLIDELGDVAVRPSSLRTECDALIEAVITEAGLTIPEIPAAVTGGRRGEHREALGYLLAEMQVLARQFPGATW